MSKATDLCDDILGLIFHGIAIADLAQNDASSPDTVLYVRLHTANPGVTGDPTINAATFGGYAAIPVNRDNTGWTLPSGGVLSNIADIEFASAISVPTGGETISYITIGTLTRVLYAGELDEARLVLAGTQIVFVAGALEVQEI